LLIKHNKLYLNLSSGVEEWIGGLFDIENTPEHKASLTRSIITHTNNAITLSLDVVKLLLDNRIYTYIQDVYKVRLTKELLPSLKKDMKITISFEQDTNPILFNLILGMAKENVTTYHMYKCIKF